MALTEIVREPPNSAAADPRRTLALRANELIGAANAGQLSSFRNAFINGAFRFWQRGTSAAAGGYVADRWVCGSITGQSRQSDAPAGIGIDACIEFAQSGSGVFPQVFQRVESINAARLVGSKLRFSGWYKNVVGNDYLRIQVYYANAVDNFGALTIIENNIVISNTPASIWTPFEAVTTNVLPAGAANGIAIVFFRGSGAASTTRMTGLQAEAVDPTNAVATPFELRPYEVELALCRRYYEKSFDVDVTPAQNLGLGTGETRYPCAQAGALGERPKPVRFQVRKRAAPTIAYFNPAAANAQVRNVTRSADCSATGAANQNENGFNVTFTGNAAGQVGDIHAIHWAAASEL